MLKRTTSLAALVVLLTLMALPGAFALQPDYASDVDHDTRLGLPGSPGVAESGINRYENMDEQVNLGIDDGNVRVLRTDQKIQMNQFVTAVIPLRNASPRELRGLARTICRKEGGNAESIWDKTNHATGEKYEDPKDWKRYMVVVCPEWQLPYVVQTLKTIDNENVKEVEDGSWVLYYKGKHRDVHKLNQLLLLHSTPDFYRTFDDANNAIVFYDQPCIAPLVTGPSGLQAVDIPPSAITLDVSIYEVDDQDDLVAGLDFVSWKNGPGQDLFRFAFWDYGGDWNGPRSDDWGRFRSYNFLATSAWVDFLQVRGKANLRTQATITAVSGTTAALNDNKGVVTFRRGPSDGSSFSPSGVTNYSVNEYPYYGYETDARGVSVSQNTVSLPNYDRTLTYDNRETLGLTLEIHPVVGLESAEVDLYLNVSDVKGYTPGGSEIVSSRSFDTTVEIHDGRPMVLSGIKNASDVDSRTGIPFLMDIPIVGQYIFGRTVKTENTKELVIFLDPEFQVFTMDDADAPKTVQTAQALLKGEDVVEVPNNSLGYDQWLLGKE